MQLITSLALVAAYLSSLARAQNSMQRTTYSGYEASDGSCTGENYGSIGPGDCYFQVPNAGIYCAQVTEFSGSLEGCTAYFYSGHSCDGDPITELGGPEGSSTNVDNGYSSQVLCN